MNAETQSTTLCAKRQCRRDNARDLRSTKQEAKQKMHKMSKTQKSEDQGATRQAAKRQADTEGKDATRAERRNTSDAPPSKEAKCRTERRHWSGGTE